MFSFFSAYINEVQKMKKIYFALPAFLLAVITVLSSCVKVPSFEDITTTLPTEGETTTEQVFATPPTEEAAGNTSEEATAENKPQSEASEETTAIVVSETEVQVSSAPQAQAPQGDGVIGTSSKGYTITRQNGITYVDGVLVANKTYGLPSSYHPGDLLPECQSAFSTMQADASAKGLNIYNASGFRSYSLQNDLYTRYSNRDGKAAADRYSARPGHSEHQTGLALDLNDITSAFANTAEGQWVAENCWRYGFILRYPQGKEAQTGYMYEPWHIRYVGVDVATKIYESGLCLEEYYGITSVYSDTASQTVQTVTEVETTYISVEKETTTAVSYG